MLDKIKSRGTSNLQPVMIYDCNRWLKMALTNLT